MLTRAFDGLGAERVVWHTDIRNVRSQAAIARLGATREGVLRHHRIRRDGSLAGHGAVLDAQRGVAGGEGAAERCQGTARGDARSA